jgi:hypothetical protein
MSVLDTVALHIQRFRSRDGGPDTFGKPLIEEVDVATLVATKPFAHSVEGNDCDVKRWLTHYKNRLITFVEPHELAAVRAT